MIKSHLLHSCKICFFPNGASGFPPVVKVIMGGAGACYKYKITNLPPYGTTYTEAMQACAKARDEKLGGIQVLPVRRAEWSPSEICRAVEMFQNVLQQAFQM